MALYTPKISHLVLSIVKAEWNKLRKCPKTPTLEFFVEFKAKRSQLNERFKEVLLFDDVKWQAHWSHVVREVLRDYIVSGDAYIHLHRDQPPRPPRMPAPDAAMQTGWEVGLKDSEPIQS